MFDIAVTPNRPDCLSHIGVAREVSAIQGGSLRIPQIRLEDIGEPAVDKIKITIDDTEACPRYSARIIEDVKIGPSPRWLKYSLESVGIRSINNVVDITNFVLMETGHPLHAFDYSNIKGAEIIVRMAGPGKYSRPLTGVSIN